MENENKFYITTPIYYASGDLHLGHCCTSVYADALARFNRALKKDVFFLTGSDEHGQKVAEKAEWDLELLNGELENILNFDMADFGFDSLE